LEGAAYATLAEASADDPAPITFEAEAEKPTRAARGKKELAVEAPIEVGDEPEADAAEAQAEDVAADVTADGTVDGQPKKKRTRRGRRGGRNRKKPTAAAAASDDVEAPTADGDGRAPRIHVPPVDLDARVDAEDVADAEPVEGVAITAV